MKSLILGGIRSGKSRLAEQQAVASGLRVVYIATATALDAAMQQRIDAHRRRRPDDWQLVEEPLALAACLRSQAAPGRCLLVDCLTLWLTNLLMLEDEARLQQEIAALLDTIGELPGQLILVSTETGLGVMPLGELSQRFCDLAGQLHQDLAQRCERVVLSVAGLPHVLKGEPA